MMEQYFFLHICSTFVILIATAIILSIVASPLPTFGPDTEFLKILVVRGGYHKNKVLSFVKGFLWAENFVCEEKLSNFPWGGPTPNATMPSPLFILSG